MPNHKYGFSALNDSYQIFTFGGITVENGFKKAVKTVDIYNTVNDTWTSIPSTYRGFSVGAFRWKGTPYAIIVFWTGSFRVFNLAIEAEDRGILIPKHKTLKISTAVEVTLTKPARKGILLGQWRTTGLFFLDYNLITLGVKRLNGLGKPGKLVMFPK